LFDTHDIIVDAIIIKKESCKYQIVEKQWNKAKKCHCWHLWYCCVCYYY